MQRLQHGLRVGFDDAQNCAGGAFGVAVALFPVLEGAGLMPMSAAMAGTDLRAVRENGWRRLATHG